VQIVTDTSDLNLDAMSGSDLKHRNLDRLYRKLKIWFFSTIVAFSVPSRFFRARLKEHPALMEYWFLGFVGVMVASAIWLKLEIRKCGVDHKEFGIYIRKQPISKIVMFITIFVVLKSIFSALKR
jgi:hypothetical protein